MRKILGFLFTRIEFVTSTVHRTYMDSAKVCVSVRSCGPWTRVIIDNRNEITFKGRVNKKVFDTVSCLSFMNEKQMYPSTVTAIDVGNSGELYDNGSKPR